MRRRTLGIALRTLRNKLNEYRELGIAIPGPAEVANGDK
jgi:hypothetical protein